MNSSDSDTIVRSRSVQDARLAFIGCGVMAELLSRPLAPPARSREQIVGTSAATRREELYTNTACACLKTIAKAALARSPRRWRRNNARRFTRYLREPSA